ncbi:MAG: 50S ribosomal protein L25/general stress protein Ctc [Burkholderiaceae bacterium]|jgi:large subunit ribosomal protein L25|nr:50S ribosomal protein L25/general stress protein Ctc [Burkholderiaceae bacterium]
MKISALLRTEQGTGASRRLRNAGVTPGIVYGGNEAPKNIKLDHNALYHALRREAFHSSILDMEIEGKTEKVLLRDYQMHAYRQQVLHIDFQRVRADQPIHVKVPLHFTNGDNSPAVKSAGALVHHAVTELDISCLPANLPEYINVDLSALEVGQTIHLSDLAFPKGVSPVSQDIAMTIVSVSAPADAEPAAKASDTEEKPKSE